MKRMILRALNAPLFVLLMAVMIAVESALFYYHPFYYFQPDLILLAVIWCALQRTFTEGGILTLLFALMGEAHSGAPQGLFLFCYMAIYLALRFTAKLVVISRRTRVITATMVAAALWKVLHLIVIAFMDGADQQWRHTVMLLVPSAAVTGATALIFYPLLDRFDQLTFKSEHSRQLLEDELLVEEGI